MEDSVVDQSEMHCLMLLLGDSAPVHNMEDVLVWGLNSEGFAVKDAFQCIYEASYGDVFMEDDKLQFILDVWKTKVPGKIKIFDWRSILNSLPSRAELFRRGIFHDVASVSCSVCCLHCETIFHLFYGCSGSNLVWGAVLGWLAGEVVVVAPAVIDSELEGAAMACGLLARFIRLSFVLFFWLLVTWCIWRFRNDVVFNNKVSDVEVIMNTVKSLGWDWFSILANRSVNLKKNVWFSKPKDYVGK
ncbi:uncharacterized protein LOC131603529 [Vicia villosa]|uniref:uncharacterized protein LOC131603529 n=1 Tax=Vicia villosa TaxID=3911 RepID=UPI00273C9B48|nr:uncharacterized protein LOC131603529 [Vicia villosa]